MFPDFDTLDKNSHLTFYVLMKFSPDKRYAKFITRETHLSYNTVLEKLKKLLELNLVKRRQDGLRIQYVLFPGVKNSWKEWAETDNGKETILEFKRLLSSKDDQPITRKDSGKEKDRVMRVRKSLHLD
ncbi:MAG: hypothetical protein ACXADA_01585 [Candidatus Hodarchaeales archaeon]|jgi:hypothetical protein